jgi:hypothetical protein
MATAATIADVNLLPGDPDPGPFVWVGNQDGSLSQLALDKRAFASNDPLLACAGTTVSGGALLAIRLLPGTALGTTPVPTFVSLHAPPLGGTAWKLLASANTPAGGAETIQIGIPWDCTTQGLGTARLTPQRLTVRRGARFALTLSWRHPTAWRNLASLELRLRRGHGIVGWTIFDQARRTLRLWTGGRGRFTTPARPGHPGLLRGAGVTLDLARSSQGDDGKGGLTLHYTAALRLARSVPPGRYSVEALAADTAAHVQGFEPVGRVTVR